MNGGTGHQAVLRNPNPFGLIGADTKSAPIKQSGLLQQLQQGFAGSDIAIHIIVGQTIGRLRAAKAIENQVLP